MIGASESARTMKPNFTMEKRSIRIGTFFVAMALGLLCFYLASTLVFGTTFPLLGLKRYTNLASSCHRPLSIDYLNPSAISTLNSTDANQSKEDDDLVKLFIEDLRARARRAAESVPERKIKLTLSPKEEADWSRKNPCRSRTELPSLYSKRKHAKDLPINPQWEEVFREYSNFHRVCMQAVGDVAKYFNEKSTRTGCKFVIADVGMYIGVGNKLQVMTNSIFYGIITRRVILVPSSHRAIGYTCEPFVGSSWKLDSSTFPTPPQDHRDTWTAAADLLKKVDRYMSSCDENGGNDGQESPLAYAAGEATNRKQPEQRFFCPTEQSFYSDITWTYFSGCLYTIPKVFAIPTFRPTLEAIFPDKVVLTRLFRSTVLPADLVWTRVMRVYDSYLQPADRRVGIQMRYLTGQKLFDDMHEVIDGRVEDCVLRNKILPQVDTQWSKTSMSGIRHGEKVGISNSTTIKVLVTSLYLSFHDRLATMYMMDPAVGGESVAVLQLTHEGEQLAGNEVDIQAYTEILLLSLSDDLLLHPISTFGGCAQAYGGLTPWFVEYRKGEQASSCERSQSEELCNQYTGIYFDCKYDPELGKKHFASVVPFVQDCPQIEFPFLTETEQGIHLMTTFNS